MGLSENPSSRPRPIPLSVCRVFSFFLGDFWQLVAVFRGCVAPAVSAQHGGAVVAAFPGAFLHRNRTSPLTFYILGGAGSVRVLSVGHRRGPTLGILMGLVSARVGAFLEPFLDLSCAYLPVACPCAASVIILVRRGEASKIAVLVIGHLSSSSILLDRRV